MISGIHHFSMKCGTAAEMDKVRDFYIHVLGMSICREWDEGIMIDSGGGYIEVFCTGDGEHRKGAVRHIAFRTDDVDGIAGRIRRAGYEVFVEPNSRVFHSSPEYRFRMAFCRGPLGEEIELFCEQ